MVNRKFLRADRTARRRREKKLFSPVTYDVKAVQKALVDLIKKGNSIRAACQIAQISESTFYNWIERGSDPAHPKYRQEYADFVRAIRRAEGELEGFAVQMWVKELPGNWQAARDFLARRFPRDWGNVEHRDIQIGGTSGVQLQLKWGDESDDHHPSETASGPEGDRAIPGAFQSGSSGTPV